MVTPSAGFSSHIAGGPTPAAGAPADAEHLYKLVERALTAAKNGRCVLSTAFYQRAEVEALRLYGETFVCTYLILLRSNQLGLQSQLEGVTPVEKAALRAEAQALASSCLPLVVRRLDANTILPGRGTAVELAFYKFFTATKNTTYDKLPLPTRIQQLAGLSLGYATAVYAAEMSLKMLKIPMRHDVEAEAFVLRVVDCMLPAARNLADTTLGEEINFACTIQRSLAGSFHTFDATFFALLRTKWTAEAMVQMRRERHLLDASEEVEKNMEAGKTRRRADVAQHGLKHCALPSCDKREASVQQYKFCSACRSVWYCSEEHGALHWAEHKPVCRATMAAQQAADDGGAGAA